MQTISLPPRLPVPARSRVRRYALPALTACCTAVAAATVPAAAASADVPGIDIASYQHPYGQAISWPDVSASGVRFVFTKASEGTGYASPWFRGDRSAAIAAGIGVGAYHFAQPADDPVAEANAFLAVTGRTSTAGMLPPVLDLEVTGGRTPAALAAWALTWLRTVKAATGRTPLLYSYSYFLRTAITPDPALAGYPLWLAAYSSTEPAAPAPWSDWTFWQYADNGVVPGIGTAVDRNTFAGTLDELKAMAGTGPAPKRVTRGDLYATGLHGTASGRVEVRRENRSRGYLSGTTSSTPLGAQSDPQRWAIGYRPYNAGDGEDLVMVHTAGTGSGRVEVHVLAAAGGYQTWLAHVATALPAVADGHWQFVVAPFDGDGLPDLWAIDYNGGGSGRVEVHVLSAASGYQTWLVHAATALAPSDSTSFTYLVGDRGDLVAIKRTGTGSGRTEVHTLTRGSAWTAFSQHVALPLAPTPQDSTQFDLVDQDSDGVADLDVTMTQATGSGTTELHVLNGRTGFGGWTLHTATGLPLLSASSWRARLSG